MVFHWSLSDSKSPQVSRTRLRILAVLSNAVVLILSLRPPISKSSRPFNNPLVIVPNAPITIGTIVTFMFNSFFNSLARSRYLSFFSLSFRFILWCAIIIYFTSFSLESELQQVTSGPQDSSQYSRQCFGLDGFDVSFDLLILRSFFQIFTDHLKLFNYVFYHHHPLVHIF